MSWCVVGLPLLRGENIGKSGHEKQKKEIHQSTHFTSITSGTSTVTLLIFRFFFSPDYHWLIYLIFPNVPLTGDFLRLDAN
jgi:hypothetical protein